MNVAFVAYHDFSSNSAIHVFNLANRLADLGVESAVLVPGDPETVHALGVPRFRALGFEQPPEFPDGGGPALVHAWTPRENVRRTTLELAARFGAPYVVHLEDNEAAIAADHLGIATSELGHADLDALPDNLSHPVRAAGFLAGAAGITVVIDRLRELAPAGVPVELIPPACEEELFAPQAADPALRDELGIAAGDFVLVYAGNVHASNAAEVRSLYLAVGLLNRRGLPVTLVRLGADSVEFLGDGLGGLREHERKVPYQPRAELPRYFALADVFVQPGRAGPFNDYRLPSKLPEFLAMGRPVVLPAANLGLELSDGAQARVLTEGHAIEIADKVETLLGDPGLRRRIGAAGRRFAEERFSWERSALRLAEFYERVLAAAPPTVEPLRARYGGRTPPRLGYATVADLADSLEHLPQLATINGDLKDVQRPWAVKAVLGLVPAGARLLEIGAGDPHVARLLGRLGYDVWVVDPYDGRDGGPADADAVAAASPELHVVRGLFPEALDERLAGTFDGIYSVSVLEHVPLARVDELCAAMRRFARPGGALVHAVDHVLKGAGEEEHLARLRRLAAGLGLLDAELDAALAALADDTETYFLSAEAHNRWRGSRPYVEFPMRRCVSIQLCCAS